MVQCSSACDQYGVVVFGIPLNAAPQGKPILDNTDATYAFGVGISADALRIFESFETC